MLTGALVLAAAASVVAAVAGGIAALVALSFAANLAGAIGRLGFESTLQRDAPQANRGRAIAGFETRFQLAWAGAAADPGDDPDLRPHRRRARRRRLWRWPRLHAPAPAPGTPADRLNTDFHRDSRAVCTESSVEMGLVRR